MSKDNLEKKLKGAINNNVEKNKIKTEITIPIEYINELKNEIKNLKEKEKDLIEIIKYLVINNSIEENGFKQVDNIF